MVNPLNQIVLWRPSPDDVARMQVTTFAAELSRKTGERIPDTEALHAFSIAQPAVFWDAVWDFTGMKGEKGARALTDPGAMPGARFFPDGRLCFAESLLAREDDHVALVSLDERGERRALTYRALREDVARARAMLSALGVGPGDRVAAFLPNIIETVVAMLATSALGGVFSSCSPDFGVNGVIDRFGQIAPKVLIAVDGYVYGGKRFDTIDKVLAVRSALPSLSAVVLVRHLDRTRSAPSEDILLWEDVLAAQTSAPLTFTRMPFDAPLYVLYSSGTTGKPKCIVHGIGGTLLQHRKEHALHVDLGPDDTLFYFTTCGWMMWNWLVTGLASGATLVLFDGSPFHPGPEALFDLAQHEKVTVFGVSAKFIDACAKAGIEPKRTHDLSRIRTILSTGSPLSPEGFDFVYEHVTPHAQLASISGGTDIVSCFVLGDPTRPVRRGEIQAKGLGMAVEVWNDEGKRVVGEMGDLVCTRPFPSMPLGFFGDADGSKYREAYFTRFPGVWCHGDFTMETEQGGFVITGRSDAVLNPGGVRIGTAEIYRPVETLPEVVDAVVIGQPYEDDVRVVLFVVLREGVALDPALEARIRTAIRTASSPRHVPARILAVPAVPRTRSGKVSELAVKRAVQGLEIKNVEALANPEALEHFRARPELA
jgi:acetoacetyl-CoA synthetase